MERADQPTEPGTPISKATLLMDSTAALYDLDAASVPDDVLQAIAHTFPRLHLIAITFDAVYAGQQFTVTQGSSTVYSGVVPAGLTKIVGVDKAETAYRINCGGVYRDITTLSYFGMQATTIRPIHPVLGDNNWNQIVQAVETGVAKEYWKIGDEADLTLSTGEIVTVQIWNFDHDDLADGSGKAKVTFGMKNLLATTYRIHSGSGAGWHNCELRDKMSAFLNQFPPELKTAIKFVSKKSIDFAGSELTSPGNDKIWIPSCSEVNYAHIYNEGAGYPIFSNNASRIKKLSNGTGAAASYWIRTANSSNKSSWMDIGYDGAYASSTPTTNEGVCLCFCL